MADGVIELNGIAYRHFEHPRYRYILHRSYEVTIDIRRAIDHPYFTLGETGALHVRAGYAWDGASGGAPNVRSIMRGSLVHDVLYQSLRERLLTPDYRKPADEVLYRMCLEDGMWLLAAKAVYAAVRLFGGFAAAPK